MAVVMPGSEAVFQIRDRNTIRHDTLRIRYATPTVTWTAVPTAVHTACPYGTWTALTPWPLAPRWRGPQGPTAPNTSPLACHPMHAIR